MERAVIAIFSLSLFPEEDAGFHRSQSECTCAPGAVDRAELQRQKKKLSCLHKAKNKGQSPARQK